MAYSLFPKTRYSRYDAVVVRCKTGKPCHTKSGAIVCIPKKHTCNSEKSSDESDSEHDTDSPNHSKSPIVTLHTREKEIDIGHFPEEASPEATNRLKIGAIAGVTVASALAGAGAVVANDLEKSAIPSMDSIPPNPPGNPEDWKDLHEYYKTLKPGDLIRKNFDEGGGRVRQHYGVYAGQDPNMDPNSIHSHLVIEVTSSPMGHNLPEIRQHGLTWYPNKDQIKKESSWEKVPESEMYQREGTTRLSQREVMNRANKMLHQKFSYEGFESNCESFARGIVEGKAYSTQADKVSPLTSHLGKIVMDQGLRIKTVQRDALEKEMRQLEKSGDTQSAKYKRLEEMSKQKPILSIKGIKGLNDFDILGLSDYGSDKHRMSASEMVDFLESAKARSERKRTGSRDWRQFDPSELNQELPKKTPPQSNVQPPPTKSSSQTKQTKQTKNKTKIPFFAGIFMTYNGTKKRGDAVNDGSLALLDPDEYMDNLKKISAKYPSLSKQIEINGIKNYLLVFYSLLNNALIPTTK